MTPEELGALAQRVTDQGVRLVELECTVKRIYSFGWVILGSVATSVLVGIVERVFK